MRVRVIANYMVLLKKVFWTEPPVIIIMNKVRWVVLSEIAVRTVPW